VGTRIDVATIVGALAAGETVEAVAELRRDVRGVAERATHLFEGESALRLVPPAQTKKAGRRR
jgi:hypothetical protein